MCPFVEEKVTERLKKRVKNLSLVEPMNLRKPLKRNQQFRGLLRQWCLQK